MLRKWVAIQLAIVVVGLVAAAATTYARSDGAQHAQADIEGVNGLTGVARFVEDGTGTVHVVIKLKNAPAGLHGTHVHANGDCGGTAYSAAGAHFDPDSSASHGSPDDAIGSHHAGDLHNTEVNVAENGHGTTITGALTVSDGLRSITGRSIIIHANEDNYTNTPVNGGSGTRIACGIIEAD